MPLRACDDDSRTSVLGDLSAFIDVKTVRMLRITNKIVLEVENSI
jgi:hypothetical protein